MEKSATPIDIWLNELSEDEKIGQLIFVSAYSNEQENRRQIEEYIKEYHIGGLIFFQGHPIRQVELTNFYQKITKTPLFIAMDAEWGLAMRLENTTKYPYQISLGALHDQALIYEMGKQIAWQCRRIGVHINFAPVVDINNNPRNPVISFRSFGEDKIHVTQCAKAYRNALQENGVMACIKHFPGHGDTDTDSHLELPVLRHSKDRLENLELYPFEQLLSTTDSVMNAHLHIPVLDKSPKASSLSYNICTEILQKKLGFQGLIFTDAMDMKAVYGHNSVGRAEVEALKAGNDILLSCPDVPRTIHAIKKAITNRELSWEQIDRKVHKILYFKYKYKLHRNQNISIDHLVEDLNAPTTKQLNQQLANQFVTILQNHHQQIIPQNPEKTILISVQNAIKPTILKNSTELWSRCIDISFDTDFEKVNQIMRTMIEESTYVIIALHDINVKPINHFGITQNIKQIINKLSLISNATVILFSNPYALQELPKLLMVKGLIIAYEDSNFTHKAVYDILGGRVTSHGKLPISLDF